MLKIITIMFQYLFHLKYLVFSIFLLYSLKQIEVNNDKKKTKKQTYIPFQFRITSRSINSYTGVSEIKLFDFIIRLHTFSKPKEKQLKDFFNFKLILYLKKS